MAPTGLLKRVKSWFASAARERRRRAASPAKRWSLSPTGAGASLALAGAGGRGGEAAQDAPSVFAAVGATPATESTAEAPANARADGLPAAGDAPRAATASSEPPDAKLAELLTDLPERIADSVAKSAAGARSLKQIADELQGHCHTNQTIADAVGRLPDLATNQTDLIRQTNNILEEQTRLAGATLEALAALRAAFRTVEESSERHLKCLGHLEATHRRVLEVYQSVLLKAHRRLGRLTALAVLVAAAALAGAAYAIYVTAGL